MFEIKFDETTGKRVACWTETAAGELENWPEMTVFEKVEFLRQNLPHSFRCGIFSGAWSSSPEIRFVDTWKEIATKCLSPTSWQVHIDDADTIAKIVDVFKDVPDCLFREIKSVIYEQKLNGIAGMLLFKDLGVSEMLGRWKRLLKWVVKYYPEFPDGFHWAEALPTHAIAWAARVILGDIKPSDLAKDCWKNRRELIQLTEHGLMLLNDEGAKKLTVEYSFKRDADHSAGDVDIMDCFGMSTAIHCIVNDAFAGLGKDKTMPPKLRKTVYIGMIPEQWMVDAGVVVGLIPKREMKKQ